MVSVRPPVWNNYQTSNWSQRMLAIQSGNWLACIEFVRGESRHLKFAPEQIAIAGTQRPALDGQHHATDTTSTSTDGRGMSRRNRLIAPFMAKMSLSNTSG